LAGIHSFQVTFAPFNEASKRRYFQTKFQIRWDKTERLAISTHHRYTIYNFLLDTFVVEHEQPSF
jgi:hypothetical protein